MVLGPLDGLEIQAAGLRTRGHQSKPRVGVGSDGDARRTSGRAGSQELAALHDTGTVLLQEQAGGAGGGEGHRKQRIAFVVTQGEKTMVFESGESKGGGE